MKTLSQMLKVKQYHLERKPSPQYNETEALYVLAKEAAVKAGVPRFARAAWKRRWIANYKEGK